jgi:flavin reductase (DIM6/NTAB) family NADH-FMN oxidoreductase RutF
MEETLAPGTLRAVMRAFATGVCIATTYRGGLAGRRHDAITVNSLTSVSLHPPLVSLCLRDGSTFLADLLATGKWALSILEGGEDATAARFAAGRPARALALDGLAASAGERTGALVLDGHAWLECELSDGFDVGDHKMVIGRVVAVNVTAQERSALAFLHGRYRSLPPLRVPFDLPELAAALPVPAAVSRPAVSAGYPKEWIR